MSTFEKEAISTYPTKETIGESDQGLKKQPAVTGLEQVSLPQPTEYENKGYQVQKQGEHLPSIMSEGGVGVPHVGPTLTGTKPKIEEVKPQVPEEKIMKPAVEYKPEEKIVKPAVEYKVGDKEVNHHYIYNKHPTGDQFSEDVFRFEETQFPRDPSENEILVRLTYVSIDAFTRNRMCERREFIQPFQLNDVLEGEATAEIIKSNNPKYQVGQNIVGFLKWTKYQIINFKNLPINIIPQDIHPSYFLSVFGMPGLTAYFGIEEYAKLKPHNNVLVSGACGSVGMFVAQILRIKGCNRLIGLESSDEKVHQSLLFGYNECYNTNAQEIHQKLRTAFPEGIDVYWDNIGGSFLDIVIEHMRPHGRIILCGTLSLSQGADKQMGLNRFDRIIAKSITIQGLFYAEFSDRFPKAYKQLLRWYHEGKIKTKETTLEGFQHIPKAFSSLLSGETMGKTVVHIEPKPALVA
jgi:NADPH-dependent curcumin reductase CurA